jgi:hypothetical protein
METNRLHREVAAQESTSLSSLDAVFQEVVDGRARRGSRRLEDLARDTQSAIFSVRSKVDAAPPALTARFAVGDSDDLAAWISRVRDAFGLKG